MTIPVQTSARIGALFLAICVSASCDTKSSSPGAELKSTGSSKTAPATAPAPSQELQDSPWPNDFEPLEETLVSLGTEAECRKRIAREIPTEVAELLTDLRYDDYANDVCKGLAAVKNNSLETCHQLSTSVAQHACEKRIAIRTAKPEVCPAAVTSEGRDAVCLAWAARNEDLCRGAPLPDAITCRAVLSAQPARCGTLDPENRARCVAEVRRYGSSLGGERQTTLPKEFAPHFELHLTPPPGAPPIALDPDTLERGLFLEPNHCSYDVRLGNVRLIVGETRTELDVKVPSSTTVPFQVSFGVLGANLQIEDSAGLHASTESGATGGVTLNEFQPSRGSPIAGTISGTLLIREKRYTVAGNFLSFVRDVDPISTSCAGAAR